MANNDVSTITRSARDIIAGKPFGQSGPTIKGGIPLSPEQTQAILRGEDVGQIVRRGGGVSERPPTQDEILEAQKATEKAAKEKARKEIEQNTRSELAKINKRFRQDLRGIKGVEDRQNRINELNRERQDILNKQGRAKVEAGLIKSFETPQEKSARGQLEKLERLETGKTTGLVVGGEKLTKDSAEAYRKVLAGKGSQADIREVERLERAGLVSVERGLKEIPEITREEKVSSALERVKRIKEGDITSEDLVARGKSGRVSIFGTGAKSLLFAGEFIAAKTGISEKVAGKKYIGAPISGQKTIAITSDLLTGVAFSPLFSAGAVTKQAPLKHISKNKFDKLREFFALAEKKVIKEKTAQGQAKVIKQLKTEFNLNEESTRILVKTLKERGIIKDPVVKITSGKDGLIFETPTRIKTPPIEEGGVEILLPPKLKGTGEITSVFSSNIKPSDVRTTLFVENKIKLKERNILGISQTQVQKSKQDTMQSQVLALNTLTKQAQQTKQTQKTRQKARPVLMSMLKTLQTTEQRGRFGRPPKQQPKIPKPKIPRPTEIIKPILSEPQQSQVVQEAQKIKDSFEAFGRRFGKDFSLGKFKTKKKAVEELKEFAEFSLGVSGFVEKAGKKVKIQNLGQRFVESKTDPFRIVEKRKFRLSTGPEVSEINLFKRKGKKRKINNNWFA